MFMTLALDIDTFDVTTCNTITVHNVFSCCDVYNDMGIKRCSVYLYLQLFVGGTGGRMSYLHKAMFGLSLSPAICRRNWRAHVLFTLLVCVCVYWCPRHIVLYCVLFVFFFVSCTPDCPLICCPFGFLYLFSTSYGMLIVQRMESKII
jgi:hypothetical protein